MAYGSSDQEAYLYSRLDEAISLLQQVVLIKKHQNVPSLANQGQALDGFSALANYNSVADEIQQFLEDGRDQRRRNHLRRHAPVHG